jgi:transcriptional regulator with XRE-family HTH domain
MVLIVPQGINWSMITGMQIRAARAAIRWSAETLALKANVGIQTVKRFESEEGVPPTRKGTLEAIKETLEAEGIDFIGSPSDQPGIRLK